MRDQAVALRRVLVLLAVAMLVSSCATVVSTTFPPTPTSTTEPEAQLHYSLKDTGITIGEAVKPQLAQISDCYYAKTEKDLVVTSGTRSAEAQAEAMYDDLKAGTSASYANKEALKQITDAYDARTEKTKAEVTAAMTAVIDAQIAAEVYISKHLIAGAVDIRSRDLTEVEEAAFIECARSEGVTPLIEGDHFHLPFVTTVTEIETPTPIPTATPMLTPTPTARPTPTATATPVPPTPTPTVTPTPGPMFNYYSGSLSLNVQYTLGSHATETLTVNATFNNVKVQVGGASVFFTRNPTATGTYLFTCSGSYGTANGQGTVTGGSPVNVDYQTGDTLKVTLGYVYTSGTQSSESGCYLKSGQLFSQVASDSKIDQPSRVSQQYPTTQFSPTDGGYFYTHTLPLAGGTLNFSGQINEPSSSYGYTWDYSGTVVLKLDRTE